MEFGTRMDASTFGVKRSKFKVTEGPTCWEMHFLAFKGQSNILKVSRLNFARLSGISIWAQKFKV